MEARNCSPLTTGTSWVGSWVSCPVKPLAVLHLWITQSHEVWGGTPSPTCIMPASTHITQQYTVVYHSRETINPLRDSSPSAQLAGSCAPTEAPGRDGQQRTAPRNSHENCRASRQVNSILTSSLQGNEWEPTDATAGLEHMG